ALGYVDQLAGWAKTGRWTSRAGVDYAVTLETISTPTWAFVGATDWMCTPRDARPIAGRIRSGSPVRVVGRTFGRTLRPDHFQPSPRPELRTLRDEIASRCVAG